MGCSYHSQHLCNLYITIFTLPWFCWYWKFCFAGETSPSSTSTATTNTVTTTGLNCASFRYSNTNGLKMHSIEIGDIICGTELFHVTPIYYLADIHFIHGDVSRVVQAYCGQINYQSPRQCIQNVCYWP